MRLQGLLFIAALVFFIVQRKNVCLQMLKGGLILVSIARSCENRSRTDWEASSANSRKS